MTIGILLFMDIAQGQNTYKFIEPNISISFDSNYFKVIQGYSNSTYETEAYDFLYKNKMTEGTIHVAASPPIKYPKKDLLDSLIVSDFNKMKNIINDTLSIVDIDSKIRTIDDFSCVGLVAYDKIHKEYGAMIKCFHFSENDHTEIVLMSNEKKLDSGYLILSRFLNGFKSYSQKEIEDEDKMIKDRYSVSVTQLKKDNNDSFTYKGLVKINEPLTNKIIEARIETSSGKEIFVPDSVNQQITITLNDKNKGRISKEGEIILLNSFGKRVSLPFSFLYVNN